MILFRFLISGVSLGLILVASTANPGFSRTVSEPSVGEVIHKALIRAQQAESCSGQHDYTYTKLSVTEELDGMGRVKERKERVYEVLFKSGFTHANLVEVNGHPPAQADIKKQAENELNVRQLLGQSKSATGDNRESFLTPELVARFDFQLVDQRSLNGRLAYQISFQPKNPNLPVHRLVDRLLDRVAGTIWIDAEEFEVARTELRLRSEVDLLGGMVGCLKKLAFTMDRTRFANGVWLNSFFSADLEGRKLLESMRIKTKSESTNFRTGPMNF